MSALYPPELPADSEPRRAEYDVVALPYGRRKRDLRVVRRMPEPAQMCAIEDDTPYPRPGLIIGALVVLSWLAFAALVGGALG